MAEMYSGFGPQAVACRGLVMPRVNPLIWMHAGTNSLIPISQWLSFNTNFYDLSARVSAPPPPRTFPLLHATDHTDLGGRGQTHQVDGLSNYQSM